MASADLVQFPVIAGCVKINNDSGLQLDDTITNTIFCTFHLGSFRIVPLLLTFLKINTALAVDENTYNTQHTFLCGLHKKAGINLGTFQLINVERASAAFEMVNILKGNSNLIFYMDGNTGISAGNRFEIPFLKNKIKVKRGIPVLSYSSKTRIVPVFTYRSNEEIHVDFLKPITPDTNRDKEDFINQSMTTLYNQFEYYLSKYPEQWEGWAYTHEHEHKGNDEKPAASFKRGNTYVFNHSRFVPIFSEGKNYFFDKHSFMSLHVPSKFGSLAQEIIKTKKVETKNMNSKNEVFYKNLVANNVLINEY
jgi:hypothetical protein